MRLDNLISNKFNVSRTKAAQLIQAGFVLVDGKIITKPSYSPSLEESVELLQNFKFCSLGGEKLEKAFLDFSYDVSGKVCVDIGASNGGFTDCMLQRGAEKVFAVDVGECAFTEQLKNNPKVVVKDRTNAREITPGQIGELCDFACIDVSFISLKLILPAVSGLLKEGGDIIALIKPQFEAGARALSKSGIVISEKTRLKVVEEIKAFSTALGLKVMGTTTAPIKPSKNVEYLIYLNKGIV